jgi:VanZ family protein
MSRVRAFWKYWLLVILWMALIFGASADTGSSKRSSRLIEPVVRWLFPQVSEPVVDAVVFYVRKGAHVAEYAVLAVLLWAAIRKTLPQNSRPWHASRVALVIGFAFLYAASDEMHQAMVPNREGRFQDVLIDITGASLGLFALWLFWKWRARRSNAATVTESSLPENAP